MPRNAARVAYERRYAAEHREQTNRASREWQARNPEKVRANWRHQYLKNATERKHYRLLRIHGVTADWYHDQLVGQAGRCAICGDVLGPGKATHIDHDHATGKVRGLLCSNCNLVLGHAHDNPRILIMAARYLEAS